MAGNFIQGAMNNALSIQTNPAGHMANSQRAFASGGDLALKLTALIDQEEVQRQNQMNALNDQILQGEKQLETGRHNLETESFNRDQLEIMDENADLTRGVANRKLDIRENELEATKKDLRIKRLQLSQKAVHDSKPSIMTKPNGDPTQAALDWRRDMASVNSEINKYAEIPGLNVPSSVQSTGQSPRVPDQLQVDTPQSPDQVSQGNQFQLPERGATPTIDNVRALNLEVDQNLMRNDAVNQFNDSPTGKISSDLGMDIKTLQNSLVSNDNADGTYHEYKNGHSVAKDASDKDSYYREIASKVTGVPEGSILSGKTAKDITMSYVKTNPVQFLNTYTGSDSELKKTATKGLSDYFVTADKNDYGATVLREVTDLVRKDPSLEAEFTQAVEKHSGYTSSGDNIIRRLESMKYSYEKQKTTDSRSEIGKQVYDEKIKDLDYGIHGLDNLFQGLLHDMGVVDKLSAVGQFDYKDQVKNVIGMTTYEDMKDFGVNFFAIPGMTGAMEDIYDIQFGGVSLHYDKIKEDAAKVAKNDPQFGLGAIDSLTDEYKEKMEFSRMLDKADIDSVPTSSQLESWASSGVGTRKSGAKRELANYMIEKGITSENLMGRPIQEIKNEIWGNINTDKIKDSFASKDKLTSAERTVLAFIKTVDMSKATHYRSVDKPLTGQFLDVVNDTAGDVTKETLKLFRGY